MAKIPFKWTEVVCPHCNFKILLPYVTGKNLPKIKECMNCRKTFELDVNVNGTSPFNPSRR